MNNVFVFFVEPASYTIDLINNVHIPKKIGYAFINSSSIIKNNNQTLILWKKCLSHKKSILF